MDIWLSKCLSVLLPISQTYASVFIQCWCNLVLKIMVLSEIPINIRFSRKPHNVYICLHSVTHTDKGICSIYIESESKDDKWWHRSRPTLDHSFIQCYRKFTSYVSYLEISCPYDFYSTHCTQGDSISLSLIIGMLFILLDSPYHERE